MPTLLSAQDAGKKIRYDIDLIQPDSFFLSEQVIQKGNGRPDTLIKYTLFRDTAAFVSYLTDQAQMAENARLQMEYFKTEFDSIDGRVKRLGQLAKKVFGIKLKPDKRDLLVDTRAIELPSVTDLPGFWVIYPPTAKAEYITDLAQIKEDAIILNQNGASMLFEIPKVKKATKKKSKKKQ